ncbi:DUF4244 domain-containing protein [Sinosporangium siamense]|uniref:DUF4244 domain-containing protein n=1 Tax=Sinosporangium siamense TaxID=1367973 RepID=A0A919RH66_9ACTN|nr:DUF4244 domain-containing protein [Sinosporangium siamense]GII93667.1 hypothetical protein Ssi02_38980 [Sinosporangium siamense]
MNDSIPKMQPGSSRSSVLAVGWFLSIVRRLETAHHIRKCPFLCPSSMVADKASIKEISAAYIRRLYEVTSKARCRLTTHLITVLNAPFNPPPPPKPDKTSAQYSVRQSPDRGMSTAEYAVGTIAACGFAALLFRIVTSDEVRTQLLALIKRALEVAG